MSGIQDDVRINERQEWQLWYLSLGLLMSLGTAAVVGFYVLNLHLAGSEGSRLGVHLVGGLAFLTVLFCGYVVHARLAVTRVKTFLHEMSGMAATNFELRDCLEAVARGVSRTFRVPLVRVLILKTNGPTVELGATHANGLGAAEPGDGTAYAMEMLTLFRRAEEMPHPLVVDREALDSLPSADPQRELLNGGLKGIALALILPLWTPRQRVGFLVLGFRSPFWARPVHPRRLGRVESVARHAATAIEEAIRRRESIHDPVTELFNRRQFHERIREELRRSSTDQSSLAVLLCDLDRFKQVNDSRGHQFGDKVLRAVASAIRAATRGTDLHFRWGGDEMVVLLCGTTEEGVLVAAERIRASVRQYAETNELDLDVSIGISMYPRHGTTEDELIRSADLAMYIAKRNGDKVRVGIDEYDFDERSVSFVCQPVLSLSSGALLGHEMFTRDPEGTLSPLEMFKKFHAVGQSGRLKRVIFELQIRQAGEAGLERLFLSSDLDFLQRVDPVPLPAGLTVIVEVSELDRNQNAEDRIHVFRKWRRAGYGLAVDDFGAGYVSLPILAQLKPDYVKVDRSSVVHAVESPKYREFLRHLLKAASQCAVCGLVAEGIETEKERETARDLGFTHAQGFHFGRPEPLSVPEPEKATEP